MTNEDKTTTTGACIDKILSENGETRDAIKCVLWGNVSSEDPLCDALSIDIAQFWKYADSDTYDYAEWSVGPHYPMWLLSDGNWWIEVMEYDSRTWLEYKEKPKGRCADVGIYPNGELKRLTSNGEGASNEK